MKGNLFKIWNRMSSGTYFPPPVRAVSIPKKSGGGTEHELLLKAVRKHVTCKWALLYIEGWLTAPMEQNGSIIERTRGTPQGA